MKFLTLLLLLFPLSLIAEPFSLEVRAGYYYPQSQRVQDVFRNGGISFELEGAYRFFPCLSTWVNANGFFRHGYTVGRRDKTELYVFPLSTGFKYIYAYSDDLSLYAGLGTAMTIVRIHDKTPVSSWRDRSKWGGVAKFGILYFFRPRTFFDFYADYYFNSGKSSFINPNVSGVRSGLGVGFYF